MTRTYYEARVVRTAEPEGEFELLYDEDGEIYGDDEQEITERAKEAYDPAHGYSLVIAKIDVTYKTVDTTCPPSPPC
jgi:hypothetical protein